MNTEKFRKSAFINILFLAVCAGILVFLLNAPEETTSPLPRDDQHIRLYAIEGKKEAEKYCGECHDKDRTAPLPDDHPPKYRCLFCHKRQ